ncbi:hypothetical protein [Stutzerimonas nitrititolerans]|uniref:hypothetical protein n=1 Tax=Stutzerimonas nitrititolerans TaxID=2482751 RepID=UPI0028AE25DF|nr:hypothetical protein [Stutzerimonas nitrititolerans]
MSERLKQIKELAAALPAQFETSATNKAVEWDDCQHSLIVSARMRKVGISPTGPAIDCATISAKKYLTQHKTLDGWCPLAGGTGDTFQQARFKLHQRHKEEARELAKQYDRKAHWLSQKATDQCIREGLDDIAEGKAPSGIRYLRNRGKGDEYVNKVRSLRNDSQNAKALESLAGHTVLRSIHDSALEVSAMHRGTLSGCLKNVAAHYINAEKLSEQVRREVAKATASIRAEQAATSRRLEVLEAGEHWHNIAKRMRAENVSYGAIATATGQKVDTVKKYLKRQLSD